VCIEYCHGLILAKNNSVPELDITEVWNQRVQVLVFKFYLLTEAEPTSEKFFFYTGTMRRKMFDICITRGKHVVLQTILLKLDHFITEG
jgi:hypothetical protein